MKTFVGILRNIVESMGQVAVISPDREFIRPRRSGFTDDSLKFSTDARQMSDALRKHLNGQAK